LQEALEIINFLEPKNSLDFETLGITGAIYKRLYSLNNNFDYLDEAIYYYRRGFIIKNDYYNGENYANCLMFKTLNNKLTGEEIQYLKYESKKVYQEVINIINLRLSKKEIDKWMYATLSVGYLTLKCNAEHEKYKKLFFNNSVEWEKNSYLETIEKLKPII